MMFNVALDIETKIVIHLLVLGSSTCNADS